MLRGAYVVALAMLVAIVRGMALPGAKVDTDIHLLMPGVQPQTPDTYMCFPHKLGEKEIYLTGFEPHANKSIAHHILLYGCEDPGSSIGVWNCGEMSAPPQDGTVLGPVCKSGAKILYAWAMDAPDLKLPEGVGFGVGGDTGINYLVLQVHYKDVTPFLPPKLEQDHSGLSIKNTDQPQPKLAGVYLLGTGGEIPAHETVYMETACSYNDRPTLHPFAFRTHAHSHGEVVAGYRVRDGKWEEIGRESPQKPQMFYPITHPGMTVESGDMLAARCTMVNDEDRTVHIGATQNDEMCNFYMMYWTEDAAPLSQDNCFSAGPPTWSWGSAPGLNSDAAPHSASIIPGTDKLLEATHALVQQAEQQMDAFASDAAEDGLLRLLEELQDETSEQQQQEMYDSYYPEFERSRYDPIPYNMDQEEEYNQISQEYPELVDDYQRARLAKDRDYENWLAQEYYRQLQEA